MVDYSLLGAIAPKRKPVTQTIKYDPDTNEQEVTIRGSAQDLSAANPNTPTLVSPQSSTYTYTDNTGIPAELQRPAVPQSMSPEQQALEQSAIQGIPQAAVPQDVGTADPGLLPDQVAQQQQAQAALQPVMPGAEQISQQQAPAVDPEQPFLDALYNAQAPEQYAALISNAEAPPYIRAAAEDRMVQDYNKRTGIARAEQDLAKLAQNPTDLEKFLRGQRENKDSKAGSFLWGVLYNALGQRELAAQQFRKVTGGDINYKSIPGGGIIGFDTETNQPVKGFNKDGAAMSAQELSAQAGLIPTAGSGGVSIATGKVFYDPRPPGTPGRVEGNWVQRNIGGVAQLIDLGTNAVATPDQARALTGLRSAEGDLESRARVQQQEQLLRLQFNARNIDLEESSAIRRVEASNASAIEKERQIQRIRDEFEPKRAAATAALETQARNLAQGFQSPLGGGAAPAQAPAGGPVAPTQTQAPAQAPAQTQTQASAAPAQPAVDPSVRAQPAGPVPNIPEQETWSTKTLPEISEAGDAAGRVATASRQQINILRNNPQIAGVFSGTGTGYSQARALILKLATGAYQQESDERLYQDAVRAGLPNQVISALDEYMAVGRQKDASSLKSTTGGGQISNAEQKINRETNLTNIGDVTIYSAMTGLSRGAFTGDLSSFKQYVATNNPNIRSQRQMDQIFKARSGELQRAYEGIYRARLDWLKPYLNKSPQERDAAVLKSFEVYPTPRFDSVEGQWKYDSQQAKQAAMRAIAGGR